MILNGIYDGIIEITVVTIRLIKKLKPFWRLLIRLLVHALMRFRGTIAMPISGLRKKVMSLAIIQQRWRNL